MDFTSPHEQEAWTALERLLRVAPQEIGQARRVANFLLAWHNLEETGGWDPVDLWSVDYAIADDILTVLRLVRESRRDPARGKTAVVITHDDRYFGFADRLVRL